MHFRHRYNISLSLEQWGKSINKGNLEAGNELLGVKSSMSSSTNTSLKICERLISFPVGRIQRDVICRSRSLECKGSIPHVRGPLTTPHNMPKSLRTYRCTEEYGEHMGVCTPLGVYKCMGHTNVGASRHPPSIKNMPTTKKSRKKPYLKLNSYT